MDPLARGSMKNAANCVTQCELQDTWTPTVRRRRLCIGVSWGNGCLVKAGSVTLRSVRSCVKLIRKIIRESSVTCWTQWLTQISAKGLSCHLCISAIQLRPLISVLKFQDIFPRSKLPFSDACSGKKYPWVNFECSTMVNLNNYHSQHSLY